MHAPAILPPLLLAAVPRPELVRWVHLDVADEECDLLLLPDDLRGSLARVLLQPRRLRADCVLVIGGAGVAAERIPAPAGGRAARRSAHCRARRHCPHGC